MSTTTGMKKVSVPQVLRNATQRCDSLVNELDMVFHRTKDVQERAELLEIRQQAYKLRHLIATFAGKL